MDQLLVPEPLSLEPINVYDSWKKWKQWFKISLLASSLSGKDVKVQVATLLHVIRPQALEVCNTFTWETPDDEWEFQRIPYSMKEYHMAETHIQHTQPTQWRDLWSVTCDT